jgi:hypothetical protein
VELVITLLSDSDKNVRRFAAETLGEIGDARAVESLMAKLEGIERYDPARALVRIYQRGELDAESKELIVAARNKIIHVDTYKKEHTDRGNRSHADYNSCSMHTDSGGHSDSRSKKHIDKGSGVNFPL